MLGILQDQILSNQKLCGSALTVIVGATQAKYFGS